MRAAIRRGIDNPHEMTLKEMQNTILYYKGCKRLIKDAAPGLHLADLRNKLLEAEARKKPTAAKKIRAVVDREGNKKMWYFINRS